MADEDQDGVVGKTVKVSILKQLQAFRYNKASTNESIQLNNSKNPKVQQNLQRPTSASCSSAYSRLNDEEKTVHEAISHKEDTKDGPNCTIPDVQLVVSSQSHILEAKDSMDDYDDGSVTEVGNSGNEETSTDNVSIHPDITIEGARSRDNVIRPINRDVVHQICSGQVIVTLCTAVKELVENCMDAGATKIDIRLIEYGSKLIEVADDACGIEEANFEGLALKHHTSKISQFEDLSSLSTFGFRGEALSSLCALANLAIVTRHRDSDEKSGYRIEYDYRGNINSKIRCARDFGTTVVLKDLFHTLPVRYKEFIKNLKKEFHRMVTVLYGYGLVVQGVRITCTNQSGNSAPQKVFSVPASNSMKERIVTLFGSKQLSSLIEIKQSEEISDEILTEYGLSKDSFIVKYELEGFISKPNHGRSSNDRQFYFINSRPCDPIKISRVINEVYHSFSRQQNPFICLHIKTSKENVDVNVTPDKRTIYLQNEKILLATIKSSLIPLLTAAASSYNPLNSLSSQSQSQLSFTFSGDSESQSSQQDVGNLPSLCLSSTFEITSTDTTSTGRNDNRGSGFASQYSTNTGRLSSSVIAKTSAFIRNIGKKTAIMEGYCRSSTNSFGNSNFKRARIEERMQLSKETTVSNSLERFSMKTRSNINDERECEADEMEIEESNEEDSLISKNDSDDEILYDDEIDMDNQDFFPRRKCVSISVNWDNVLTKTIKSNENESNSLCYARKFRAKISPEDNSVAEDELKKQLTKDMFRKMQIIGQFNLGFIVVKNGPDLFIVDQHASDEKYNYEDQEKSTVLNGQLLISPMDLELPAVSENIILDNLEVFRKNGFDFIISPDEEPRKRVRLLKIPFSKNIEFGKSDVEELIFMLEDATSSKCFYRPTKVRDMFASRACRKSVMIGTALNNKEMRLIVDHIGEMEQPWNCPHGRPTIRHLINLNLLPDLDLTKFNH